MTFGSSGVFKQFILDPVYAGTTTSATGYGANGIGASGDTCKAALYGNSGTPDKDAAVASTGYNTGAWVTGNELTSSPWVAGGVALTTPVLSSVTNAVQFAAANVAPGGTPTLTAVYGCLVYDDTITAGTVADQGVCFNYFGGSNSVVAGTFTIVWHANGIFRVAV